MVRRAYLVVAAALAVAACGSHAPASSAGADGGLDGAVDAGCAPQPVTVPAVPWIPPHALHVNVCVAQDAAAIASCVVQGQSCTVLVSATCRACAVSGDAGPTSAAVIVHDPSSGKSPELNIAGCVGAASGDPSSAGCGPKLAARDACVTAACAACPAPGDHPACVARAATTVCAAASAGAQCAAPYLAQCSQGTTELEIAFNLINVFCGP